MLPQRNGTANLPQQLPCERLGCNRWFKTLAGRTKHYLAAHPTIHDSHGTSLPPSAPSLDPSTCFHSSLARPSDTENRGHLNPDRQCHEELRMGGTLRQVFHPHLNGKFDLFAV